jgi:hypothetical protein
MGLGSTQPLTEMSSLRLKCDDTRAETRFRLSAKRTSPFKSARASVQSTAGSRGVRISGSNAGYTMFRRSVKSTGYPLHSPVSPSLPLPWVTVCHHISTGLIFPLPVNCKMSERTPRPTIRHKLSALSVINSQTRTHQRAIYELDELGFESLQRQEIFFFCKTPRPAPGPAQ